MTTTSNKTPAKATPAKATNPPVVNEENSVMPDITEGVAERMTTPETEEKPNRIPEALASQAMLEEFCKRYLEAFDEISVYNKGVLAEKTSDWTSSKVLAKAQELGNPTDASVKPNDDIKSALKIWEDAVQAMNVARRKVVDITAKELGITLSATAERDPKKEEELKPKRAFALEIGKQLVMIANMTTDKSVSAAATKFLNDNELPAIGRDQTHSFGESGKATPKYRVHIQVTKDDATLLDADGFTKTALELSKPEYGYERGKQPKSEDLRKAWEAAGNTPENTVKATVEFEDNGLKYVISKK